MQLMLLSPKQLVKHLVRWVADHIIDEMCYDVLLDIVDTPISPELLPANEQGEISQKTENLVGPYELHDFFLYYTLRYGFRPSKIFHLAVGAFAKADASRNVSSYTESTIAHWLQVFSVVSSSNNLSVVVYQMLLKWEAVPLSSW